MLPATRKQIEKRFGKIKIYRDGFRVSMAKHRGGSGPIQPIVQEKPWGAEVWLIFTKRYALKLLMIEKGQRFSLQKHKSKEESWLVLRGRALITLGKKEFEAKTGTTIHVARNTIHRLKALSSLVEVMEASSPELHDAVRLVDDYNRIHKKYNPR